MQRRVASVVAPVDRPGAGTGAVSATSLSCAGGANTQQTPCTATYTQGASVTLTASADAGSMFVGWSGACSGTGSCVLTTMMTPRFVVAGFSIDPNQFAQTYYHTDAIGSVRALTDATGATVARYDYAPFGEDSQPLTGNPIRFTGQELDSESGHYYYGARYYRNI